MATHSSILARKIPWTEEPGGLLSMGLQTVKHDLATKQQPYSPQHLFLPIIFFATVCKITVKTAEGNRQ